jgi:hypothetical protein
MARARRADGTVGHPYSALNLRLVLAVFGALSMLAIGVLAWAWDIVPVAVVAFGIAAVAIVNAVVVQRRRVQRHRREPGSHHSLFE